MIEAVEGYAEPEATVLYHGRTLHYMQLVEGKRLDVRLVDPFYSNEWVREAERGLRRGPTYIMGPGRTNARLYKDAGYVLSPVGSAAGEGAEAVRLYEISKRP